MENSMEKRGYFWFVAACCVAYSGIQAQNCPTPTSGQFRKVMLVNEDSGLDKPDHMAVLPDGRVFITEMRSGRVKLYTPDAGLTEVLRVNVYNDAVENGLLGIAADPGFATNNWVYIFYSRTIPGGSYSAGDGGVSPHQQVLARYTFSGGKLTNPKELLIVPRLSKRHSAGGMTFNPRTGDLFLTTGDDVYPSADQTRYGGRNEASKHLNSLITSANTNDLRGKTLRIRPLPFPDSQTPEIGVDKTYGIPPGNLYPPGTAKTRPEIYTMGHRNPYKIKVDPVSGVGLIGEVGPDGRSDDANRGPRGYDEFNLIAGPANYGWPFGVANNRPFKAIAGEPYPVGTQFDMGNLKNLSQHNTGLTDLPPAVGAIGYYTGASSGSSVMAPFGTSGGMAAIAGPYYRYQEELNSTTKLPAFFHGKFIASCWERNKLWTLELNSSKALVKVQEFATTTKAIDLAIGPKGELYVLEYADNNGYHGTDGTGRLYKIEYTGTQYAASACAQYVLPEAPTSLARSPRPGFSAEGSLLVNLALTRQVAAPSGMSKGILFDLKGGRVWEGRIKDGRLDLPTTLENDLVYLQFK
jgi:glucose/arabinose dehydrogenase